jgi:two-component system alkaline phosphatase synthesis response regulator PhoP
VKNRRLLLVDDDDDLRDVARLSLESVAGFDVVTASCGEEALTLACDESLDAILLDVLMPGMDGGEVATRLRADPRTERIPIVLLTATPTGGLPASLDSLGIHLRIAKPFNPMEIGNQLVALLGW